MASNRPDPYAEQITRARVWLDDAPRLVRVLGWHRHLCLICRRGARCGEIPEIISEYDASELAR